MGLKSTVNVLLHLSILANNCLVVYTVPNLELEKWKLFFMRFFFCPYFFKWWNRCFLYTVFSSNLFAEIEWYIRRLLQNENCSSNESERGQFSCLENGTANFLKKLLTKWRCRTPQENKTFTRLVSLAARPSGSLTDRKRMMTKKYRLTLRFGSGIQNFFS